MVCGGFSSRCGRLMRGWFGCDRCLALASARQSRAARKTAGERLLDAFHRYMQIDITMHRHRNPAGLLGNDEGDTVGFLSDTDGCPMAGSEVRRKLGIRREREKTGRGCDAVALHDHRAIMQ